METMILVAGLAVAGLLGIAAAFYFSIRASRGGSKRHLRGGRSAGPDPVGTDRRPGSRRSGTANPGRAANGRRSADNGQAANPGWAANDDRLANSGRAANAASRNYRADDRTGSNAAADFGDADDHGLLSGRAPAPAGHDPNQPRLRRSRPRCSAQGTRTLRPALPGQAALAPMTPESMRTTLVPAGLKAEWRHAQAAA
jgi:hypothetical protein